jgi:transposase
MTNYKEILRLHSMGINNTRIAESCSCARSTVISTIQKAAALGLQWSELKDFSETETARKLYPETAGGRGYKMPDYEFIHREMQKSGVTLSLLWVEYCEQCRAAGEIPYQSTQFNKYYAEYVHKTRATMHLEHKPGETMQVDWAGQTAGFRDTDTGEIIPAHLFVSVLPYSGYAYVEAFSDERQESWIEAHVHAYAFYGGSTRILTPDNLKTGIVKNTKDDLVINRTYREMAEHYGTAIIPARPRSPKDKAFVEGSVGVVSTWIIAALRNRQFFSLAELNEAIGERLYAFNHKPFQKKDGSRAKTFEEEKPFLLQLPSVPFELAEWKIATVQYNYHISADKQNYSVPYEYIKQRVDVRLTSHTVEVFFEGNRIASHPRLYGRPNQYSTLEMHMPPDHQQYLQWTGDRFIRWAEQIGPNTSAVVKLFLTANKVEQQGYKSCMALLKLTDKFPPERLENACKKALSFTPQPSCKSIQSILKSGQDKLLTNEEESRPVSPDYSFTRGAEYYRRDK